MKKTLLILSCILTIHLTLFAQSDDPKTFLRQGDNAFQTGNYQAAIASYEQVIKLGYESASLYYNLGNAYYRQGLIGYAILNYERSLRLKPYDSDTKDNLSLAQSKTTDHIDMLPSVKFKQWLHKFVGFMSLRGWEIVMIVLLGFLATSIVCYFLLHQRKQRKQAFLIGTIALLLLLLSIVGTISQLNYTNTDNQAIVVLPEIEVFNTPQEGGSSKFLLHEGTSATIEERLGDWLQISLYDGNIGWVKQENIEKI